MYLPLLLHVPSQSHSHFPSSIFHLHPQMNLSRVDVTVPTLGTSHQYPTSLFPGSFYFVINFCAALSLHPGPAALLNQNQVLLSLFFHFSFKFPFPHLEPPGCFLPSCSRILPSRIGQQGSILFERAAIKYLPFPVFYLPSFIRS